MRLATLALVVALAGCAATPATLSPAQQRAIAQASGRTVPSDSALAVAQAPRAPGAARAGADEHAETLARIERNTRQTAAAATAMAVISALSIVGTAVALLLLSDAAESR